ncbi:MAG: peptidoglycan DD-metalloendopeptidase family protein [Propionibacteriaceae bacterium]|nr:peptidoglycan DD-metalloendopeptidase family protein [Propionibacteriaceae bacterium]
MLSFTLGTATLTSTFADELDDRKDELTQQLADERANIAAAKEDLAAAQQELANARGSLEQAQAELNIANRELEVAQAEDARLAKELEIAIADLDIANEKVRQGEIALQAQRDRMTLSVQALTQNEPTLILVAIFFANLGTVDFADQVQWTREVFNIVQSEFQKLLRIQSDLEAAQKLAADAEQAVRSKREEAAAAYAVAQDKQRAAQAAADRVLLLIQAASDAEKSADSSLAIAQASEQDLLKEMAAIQAEIAKRDPGESRPADSGSFFHLPLDPGWSLTSPFGWRIHPVYGYQSYHSGTDLANGCGKPLYAAEAGQVIRAGYYGEFGNYTVIDHGLIDGNRYSTGYAHQVSFAVSVGDWVYRGQLLGYTGRTGLATGCHVHWQVWKNGVLGNVMEYV